MFCYYCDKDIDRDRSERLEDHLKYECNQAPDSLIRSTCPKCKSFWFITTYDEDQTNLPVHVLCDYCLIDCTVDFLY